MSDQHDFRPAFNRLAALHGWDNLPAGPPPVTHTTPRPIPPARQDHATTNRWGERMRALARATRGRA